MPWDQNLITIYLGLYFAYEIAIPYLPVRPHIL